MLGYKDALNARIAVTTVADGTAVVSRSLLFPSGDINGQARERLHGFFVTKSDEVTPIDPIAEADHVRDQRLESNGKSIALAYRTNGGPTRLVALTAKGAPRGETAEVSKTMSRDVRLTVSPSGSYAVAYDEGTRLLLRNAVLDPTPDADAGVAGAGGGPSSTASGSSDSGGCGCTLPGQAPRAPWALAGALALLLLQRSRARASSDRPPAITSTRRRSLTRSGSEREAHT